MPEPSPRARAIAEAIVKACEHDRGILTKEKEAYLNDAIATALDAFAAEVVREELKDMQCRVCGGMEGFHTVVAHVSRPRAAAIRNTKEE